MDLDIEQLKHTGQIETLDEMQWLLEDTIANYAVVHSEDLLDEEEECVSRFVVFNRGTKDFRFVFTPTGYVRYFEERMPTDLMVDIHNVFVEYATHPLGVI